MKTVQDESTLQEKKKKKKKKTGLCLTYIENIDLTFQTNEKNYYNHLCLQLTHVPL